MICAALTSWRTLLGFTNWADYVTADKMVGQRARTRADFIDRHRGRLGRAPSATTACCSSASRRTSRARRVVNLWENGYWTRAGAQVGLRLRLAGGAPLLPLRARQAGRARRDRASCSASRTSGCRTRRCGTRRWSATRCTRAASWSAASTSTCTRAPNKYNHAAQFDIRTGVEGRQIPEAALVCNFPGGEPGDPGLMETAT